MPEQQEQRPISSWGDLFMRTLELGLGAATLTLDTAQKIAGDLVGRGQVTSAEGETLVDRLMAMGHEQRAQLNEMIEKATERAMERLDLARRSDLEALQLRVADLERAAVANTQAEAVISPVLVAETDETE